MKDSKKSKSSARLWLEKLRKEIPQIYLTDTRKGPNTWIPTEHWPSWKITSKIKSLQINTIM